MMHMEGPLGPRMRIDGRDVDYFCGTSYYCLHGHPKVIDAACEATRRFGLGPGTLARMQVYDDLTAALCDWFGCERAIYMISGYSSPLALLLGLRDEIDVIFADEITHFSFRDAFPVLGLPVHGFRHRDADDLRRQIRGHLRPGQVPAVATDGVFPSSGALAPLSAYRRILDDYEGGALVADDSHGLGVLGQGGRGALELEGAEGRHSHVAGTLSKAFGGSGGVIPCDETLAKRIAANALILRGASPPPPAAAAAALAGLTILRDEPERRARLAANTRRMRDGLRALGFELPDTPVPICTIRGEGRVDLARAAEELGRRDILVKLTPGSGYSDAPPEPTLRIAVFSEHDDSQIDRLLTTLGGLL